jgi:hypothetical protein
MEIIQFITTLKIESSHPSTIKNRKNLSQKEKQRKMGRIHLLSSTPRFLFLCVTYQTKPDPTRPTADLKSLLPSPLLYHRPPALQLSPPPPTPPPPTTQPPSPAPSASHPRCRRRRRSGCPSSRPSAPSATFPHWVLRYELASIRSTISGRARARPARHLDPPPTPYRLQLLASPCRRLIVVFIARSAFSSGSSCYLGRMGKGPVPFVNFGKRAKGRHLHLPLEGSAALRQPVSVCCSYKCGCISL